MLGFSDVLPIHPSDRTDTKRSSYVQRRPLDLGLPALVPWQNRLGMAASHGDWGRIWPMAPGALVISLDSIRPTTRTLYGQELLPSSRGR